MNYCYLYAGGGNLMNTKKMKELVSSVLDYCNAVENGMEQEEARKKYGLTNSLLNCLDDFYMEECPEVSIMPDNWREMFLDYAYGNDNDIVIDEHFDEHYDELMTHLTRSQKESFEIDLWGIYPSKERVKRLNRNNYNKYSFGSSLQSAKEKFIEYKYLFYGCKYESTMRNLINEFPNEIENIDILIKFEQELMAYHNGVMENEETDSDSIIPRLFSDIAATYGLYRIGEIFALNRMWKNHKELQANSKKIADIDLSQRSKNALMKSNITDVAQLYAMSFEEIRDIQGLGKDSLKEVITKCGLFDIDLKQFFLEI